MPIGSICLLIAVLHTNFPLLPVLELAPTASSTALPISLHFTKNLADFTSVV